jgi:Flp pilus assembly pilin Flp
MKAATVQLGRFIRRADGFEGAEYAVMTALIVGAIIAALITLGLAITTTMGTTTNTIAL